MNSMSFLAEFFMLALGFGVGLFSFLADTKATGAGFMRVISSICFASLTFGFGIHLTSHNVTETTSLLYLASMGTTALVFFFHKDNKNFLMWSLFAITNVLLAVLSYLNYGESLASWFFVLSSILFLGIVTYAMILGHWYLVTPKLSELPLKKSLIILWVLLVIKVGLTSSSVYSQADLFTEGTTAGAGYIFNWMMLLMRIGWGYFIIGIMSYFTWKLVAMRSLQSATGILYVMTFFVFVGEIISSYLFLKFGMLV